MTAPVALEDAITETLADAIIRAAGLVDDLDAQQRRETAAYAEGYVTGWGSGYDVGEGSVYERIAEGSRLASGSVPRGSPLEELVRRRADVGDACREFTARHGGEYKGGPVDFQTGRPHTPTNNPGQLRESA